MTHKQNLETHTHTNKEEKYMIVDGRFDKAFYYGFHKRQIA